MKAYMFPGQGSQNKGMGGELFDKYPDLVATADEILGYSIKELCLEDPRKELGQTQFTQPALYVVNALSYYDIRDTNGEKPDFVAGHSLGEFNALLAAEVFSFAVGLKLVKKRGELMGQVSGGGMAAIINSSKEDVESILKLNGLDQIDLANFNTGSQIVISSTKEQIDSARRFFNQGKVQFHPLKTSGAFHSRFMVPSMKEFEAYLKKFKLSAPQIPVISNVTAQPYKDDKILENLALQIASSVKWNDSVKFMINQANAAGLEMEFVECGHGNVLTGLVRKINREVVKTAQQNLKKKTQQKQKFVSAEQLVKDWNAQYSVGARFKSTIGNYQDLQTRTEAKVLFGLRAVVYMKNYKGYFNISELESFCGN